MMRLELVRMIVAALVHPTRGVNAKLPGVPRDEGDVLPAAIVAVYDITRDDHVVNRSEPPKIPCLYVIDEGPVAVDGEQMTGTYRDTAETVAVTIRYVAGGHDLAKAGAILADDLSGAKARLLLMVALGTDTKAFLETWFSPRN